MSKRCYQFAAGAPDDHVLFGSALAITGAFSISFWVNILSPYVRGNIMGDGLATPVNEITIAALSAFDTKFPAFHQFLPSPSLTLNVWHHFIFTQVATSGDRNWYLGGLGTVPVLEETNVETTSTMAIDRLGGNVNNLPNSATLAMKLLDVRVFSDVLTAAERTILNRFGEVSADLEISYRCNDTHATIATDSGPNLNHGTKTNVTLPGFHYLGADVPHDFALGKDVAFDTARDTAHDTAHDTTIRF